MKETKKNQQEAVYRTGATTKEKGRGGLMAVLLVLVILFGGIASALGIMNIQLLESLPLPRRQEIPITFSPADQEAISTEPTAFTSESPELSGLGLSVETVTSFLQLYYALPPGVYITDVAEGSGPEAAGCLPGDIITKVNDTPVADANGLIALLSDIPAGQDVVLTLYRAGETFALRLTAESR